MNQSILFSDQRRFCEDTETIVFEAQQSGALIVCKLSLASLVKLAQKTPRDSDEILKLFDQYRFDIEELAEELIEDEAFNASGEIEL